MNGRRALRVHFWVTAFTLACVTATGFLVAFRAGVFDQPEIARPVVVRMVPKFQEQEQEPVEVWVNNTPDESECLDIIEDHGDGRKPDLVVEVHQLRELPEVKEESFDEAMERWKRGEEERIALIDRVNKSRKPGQRTYWIPPEPSPEEIRLRKRWEEQNEIQARITEENANREFELIERRERERLERRRKTLEETRQKVAYYQQFHQREQGQ